MLEWRIRESAYGGYVAEKLGNPEKRIEASYVPGIIMGAVLYESCHFNTLKQAEKFIKERQKKDKIQTIRREF